MFERHSERLKHFTYAYNQHNISIRQVSITISILQIEGGEGSEAEGAIPR